MSFPSGEEKYRLIRLIGRGGMGEVYEAWDLRLDRRVALKFLHTHFAEGDEGARNLEREARISARIEHPNVVRVYGIEVLDGHVVIVMQFIEGAPLHTLLAAGKLAPCLAADLLRQFLKALVACHGQRVIHCDLKPGNLLITPEGHLYLSDFGISHSARGSGDGPESSASAKWGTPRYIPPEAWRGEKPGPRWDLYSAGAVMYEVISGEPYRVDTDSSRYSQPPKFEKAESIAERVPELSAELASLIDRMTASDPNKRPEDAARALELLRATPEYLHRERAGESFLALFQSIGATEETTRYNPKMGVRKRAQTKYAVAVGLFVVVILAMAFGLFHWGTANKKVGIADDGASNQAVVVRAAPTVRPAQQPFDSGLVKALTGVYFAYDDGIHGSELWTCPWSDGAMALFKDIVPGPEPSNPRNFFARGPEEFVFAATTPDSGEELWDALLDTAGKARDFRQIMDILPGPMSSEPFPLEMLQTTILFDAKTLAYGHELWCTNTRAGQTAIVADLVPGPLDSVPYHSRLSVDARGAYMVAYSPDGMRLWRFELGTNSVREIAPVDADTVAMQVGDNLLALTNRDVEHGMELWIYDPAQSGIHLLMDIWPGPESSWPGSFFLWKEILYFSARTEEFGVELWRTDGTVDGTWRVSDINAGPESSEPYGFVDAGRCSFFRAHDNVHGNELWMTDGTPSGTRIAADVWKGPESGTPYNIVPQGNTLFFSASDGVYGEELWMLKIDDPASTLRLVADLWPGAEGSEPVLLNWKDDEYGIFKAKTGPGVIQLVQISNRSEGVRVHPVPLPRG